MFTSLTHPRPVQRLIGAGFMMVCLLAWELSARQADSVNFPSFLRVVQSLWQERNALMPEFLITLSRAASGLALAIVVMVPAGIAIGRIRAVGAVCEPLINLLRPLPPLAIVPVVMLFAGPGSLAKIIVVFYGASVPILLGTIDGVRDVHPMLSRVAASLRLSRLETMRLVDLPAALPRIVAGIRLGLAVSLLIAVSTEMLLSADGLGTWLVRSQESFRIADALAGLLVIAIGSLLVNALASRIERMVLRWHHMQLGSDNV